MIELVVHTPEQMAEFGARVAGILRAGDIVALDGQLGAGKTTFTRGLGEALGVRGAVTSPTFVLARTHPRENGIPLVHADAYRLGDAAQLDDLDIDYAGSITVVEWAAGMLDGVADSVLWISIARPTGASASATPVPRPSGASASASPVLLPTGASASASPDEEPIEPRTVTITPTGPRWAGVALDALLVAPLE